MKNALLMLAAFLLMEPVAAIAHRFVFHGFAYKLHKADHEPGQGVFRKIDYFPVISALITAVAVSLGVWLEPLDFLIPAGFGMGAYGLAYWFIHDIAIHGRARAFKVNLSWFKFHYDAHMFHHRFNGPPYGLVFPYVSKRMSRYLSKENGSSSENE